ncbi:hypothetical protein [Subtercola vilae]|uniref:hypothetical protein n=1 Tax=Subtercola vilae TaxID=2056433 RepID=UPI0010AB27E3|nr:hypothetical protein [Subtercola vilae]
MTMYWLARLGSVIGWVILIGLAVVIPAAILGMYPYQGRDLSETPIGLSASGVLIFLAFLAGMAYRIHVRASGLRSTVRKARSAPGFVTRCDSISYRLFESRLSSGLMRFGALGNLNVVASEIGIEFWWPLRLSSEQRLIVLEWHEIRSVTRSSRYGRQLLQVDLKSYEDRIEFQILRGTLKPVSMQAAQTVVDHFNLMRHKNG